MAVIANAAIIVKDGLFGAFVCVSCDEVNEKQQSQNENPQGRTEPITSSDTLIQPVFFPYATSPFEPVQSHSAFIPQNAFYMIQRDAVVLNKNRRRQRRPTRTTIQTAPARTIPMLASPLIAPIAQYSSLMAPPTQHVNTVMQTLPVNAPIQTGQQWNEISSKNIQTMLVPSNQQGQVLSVPVGSVATIQPANRFVVKPQRSRTQLKPAYTQDLSKQSEVSYSTLIRPGQALMSESDQTNARPKLSVVRVAEIEELLRRLKPLVDIPSKSATGEARPTSTESGSSAMRPAEYQLFSQPDTSTTSLRLRTPNSMINTHYPNKNRVVISGVRQPDVAQQSGLGPSADELAFMRSLAQLKTHEKTGKYPMQEDLAEKFYSNKNIHPEQVESQSDAQKPIPVETLVDQLMLNSRVARFGANQADGHPIHPAGEPNVANDLALDDEVLDPSVEGVNPPQEEDDDDDDDEYFSEDDNDSASAESSPDYIVTKAPIDMTQTSTLASLLPQSNRSLFSSFNSQDTTNNTDVWRPLRALSTDQVSTVDDSDDETVDETDSQRRQKRQRRWRNKEDDSGLVIGDRPISRMDLIRLISIVSKMGNDKSKTLKERQKIKKLLRFLVRVALENFKQDQLERQKLKFVDDLDRHSKKQREPLRSLLSSPRDDTTEVKHSNATESKEQPIKVKLSPYLRKNKPVDDETSDAKANNERENETPKAKAEVTEATKKKLSSLSEDLERYLDKDFFDELGGKVENAGDNFTRTDNIRKDFEKEPESEPNDLPTEKPKVEPKTFDKRQKTASKIDRNPTEDHSVRSSDQQLNAPTRKLMPKDQQRKRRKLPSQESSPKQVKSYNGRSRRRQLKQVERDDDDYDDKDEAPEQTEPDDKSANATQIRKTPKERPSRRRPFVGDNPNKSSNVSETSEDIDYDSGTDGGREEANSEKLSETNEDPPKPVRQPEKLANQAEDSEPEEVVAPRRKSFEQNYNGELTIRPTPVKKIQKGKRRRDNRRRVLSIPSGEHVHDHKDRALRYYESRDEIPAPIVANEKYEAKQMLARSKRKQINNRRRQSVERSGQKRHPRREYEPTDDAQTENKPDRSKRLKRPSNKEDDVDMDEEIDDSDQPSPTIEQADGEPIAHLVEGTSYSGICEDDGNCQVTLKSNNPKLGRAIKARDEPGIARHLNKWMGDEEEQD